MFLHMSIIMFTGEVGCLGPHPGGRLGGLVWGVSRPTPRGCVQGHTRRVQAHAQGGVSQHALRQTPPPPPSRCLLLWAVRILLECILVDVTFRQLLAFSFPQLTLILILDVAD